MTPRRKGANRAFLMRMEERAKMAGGGWGVALGRAWAV
jgi:hypothetical protein